MRVSLSTPNWRLHVYLQGLYLGIFYFYFWWVSCRVRWQGILLLIFPIFIIKRIAQRQTELAAKYYLSFKPFLSAIFLILRTVFRQHLAGLSFSFIHLTKKKKKLYHAVDILLQVSNLNCIYPLKMATLSLFESRWFQPFYSNSFQICI